MPIWAAALVRIEEAGKQAAAAVSFDINDSSMLIGLHNL